jgi:hypothetical protein
MVYAWPSEKSSTDTSERARGCPRADDRRVRNGVVWELKSSARQRVLLGPIGREDKRVGDLPDVATPAGFRPWLRG